MITILVYDLLEMFRWGEFLISLQMLIFYLILKLCTFDILIFFFSFFNSLCRRVYINAVACAYSFSSTSACDCWFLHQHVAEIFFFFFLALDVFRKEFQQKKKTGALLNYVCAVLQQLFCYEILSFICLNYWFFFLTAMFIKKSRVFKFWGFFHIVLLFLGIVQCNKKKTWLCSG